LTGNNKFFCSILLLPSIREKGKTQEIPTPNETTSNQKADTTKCKRATKQINGLVANCCICHHKEEQGATAPTTDAGGLANL